MKAPALPVSYQPCGRDRHRRARNPGQDGKSDRPVLFYLRSSAFIGGPISIVPELTTNSQTNWLRQEVSQAPPPNGSVRGASGFASASRTFAVSFSGLRGFGK